MSHESHIEKLFREQFDGYSVQPSPGFWPRLNHRLGWREFLRFSWNRFNAYYAGILVAATGITLGWLLSREPADNGDSSMVVRELQQENQQVAEEKHIAPAEEPQTSLDKPVEQSSGEMEKRSDRADRKRVRQMAQAVKEPREAATRPEIKGTSGPVQSSPVPEVAGETLPPPVADYHVTPHQGCVPLTVMCVSLAEYADTYEWHFGDGGVSDQENTSYIYDEPGEYPLTLRVMNDQGESVLTRDTIRVYATPEAVFEISPADPDLPDEPVFFYNYSRHASRFLWDFGDGHKSEEMEPLHKYDQDKPYDILLLAYSEGGCVDSALVKDAFGGKECEILFPNAFLADPGGPSDGYYSPNDPANSVFHPICKGVAEYQLKIFNRTGALVFESNRVEIGWDGYINGTPARQDVYVWKVRGTFENGKSFVKHGNVTLIWNK